MHFSQVILKTLVPLQEIEFNNKSNYHQFCFFFVLMSSQIELATEWMSLWIYRKRMGSGKYRQRCKSISKRGRHTPAFYNVKEIEWRWCKGKQFQWNNSTWAYFFKLWLRDSQFLWWWLWIEAGIIFYGGMGHWRRTQIKTSPSAEPIPKFRKPKIKSNQLALSFGSLK